ncbi:nucleotide exchange factor GrpE [Helicobacter mustelae]|uniref:Protein GrpE n=1 Tax=Helicobacter mustelae (strain ATCC 43772 / CCUG 25715 / CIP 103759 / LMG 18044 / NCTC 12198 / R85-136P) TaxID=679897 RepID=D3UHE4_HELM1|nr:nucleotide exchange factor GrpE [Helicobacter mustelae]CBG39916.1 heat shock protein grpE [Helicobacter mustelae 12198]SQH71427.1 heat shock protein GrpE [Helicobacter mustelae]STP12556.1 heat shock protein GrpE [Helicobacter mustelae]
MSELTKEELLAELELAKQEYEKKKEEYEKVSLALEGLEHSHEHKDQQNSSDPVQETQQQEDYEQKYNELKNEYLRVFADFENSKKRLEKDKVQALEYAYEKFAKDLLPILDALHNAKEVSKENPAILEGIIFVVENLIKTLAKYGIEEIPTDGDFDPNFHDCIMQVPHAELDEGAIAQVMQKGYKYKERTLRPAMVAIVKN